MLKIERQQYIRDKLNNTGIVRVSDLTDIFNVTEMTIRRDLKELEEEGVLRRIHGGAKSLDTLSEKEYSHNEKRLNNHKEKLYIAKIIASMIQPGDTVFLGPGTTIELVGNMIKGVDCKIVTNSYYIFNKLAYASKPEVLLTGGYLRKSTGAFVGSFVNDMLRSLRVQKAFVGVNGINENDGFTSNGSEGELLKIILDNSFKKYFVCDNSKIGREDFYSFYNLDEINAVITDRNISEYDIKALKKYTKVITEAADSDK